MGIENNEGHPSFGELQQHLEGSREVGKLVDERVAEIEEELGALEAQLDFYIGAHEISQEQQLPPMATEQEIDNLQARVTSLKEELEKMEGYAARIVRLIDRLELLDKELTKIIIHRPPTSEDSPDDQSQ